MLKKIFLIICFTLSACATPAKYEAELAKLQGKTEQQLISSWGQPTNTKELPNGNKILTYTYLNKQILPAPEFYNNMGLMDEDEIFYPFTYGGNVIPDGNFLGETITEYCQTKFFIRRNIVTSWQYKGNACVAI